MSHGGIMNLDPNSQLPVFYRTQKSNVRKSVVNPRIQELMNQCKLSTNAIKPPVNTNVVSKENSVNPKNITRKSKRPLPRRTTTPKSKFDIIENKKTVPVSNIEIEKKVETIFTEKANEASWCILM